MTGSLGEFGRIRTILAPLTEAHPASLGLVDDAALLAPDLVVTTDALTEGVDFFPDDLPGLVARKLLRVNLSDLAAMGARPECYLLTLVLPSRCDDAWVARFAAGLAADQRAFGIRLIGGDSGSTPGPITLSATLFGRCPAAAALRRDGARPGDLVFVSGTIGDGALGLLACRDEVARAAHLVDRYRVPQPRVALGMALRGLVHAAIDVSDGLVADLDHLCAASQVGATIAAAQVPLSAPAQAILAERPELMATVLTGGDDYELLFTASAAGRQEVERKAAEVETPIRVIGRIDGVGRRTTVLDSDGNPVALGRTGWRHA